MKINNLEGVIDLFDSEKPIVIAIGFWDVVNVANLISPTTGKDCILLRYKRGQINRLTAINELDSLKLDLSETDITLILEQLAKKFSWSAIYEEAGADIFKAEFIKTIETLRFSLSGMKLGLVIDGIPKFVEMLNQTKISEMLDFVINRQDYDFDQKFSFAEKISKLFGDSRIIFVDAHFDDYEIEGCESLTYNNQLTTDRLINTIVNYFVT